MLSGCLVSLITLQNDIILKVHGRKRFETLVRVLQSENGECHEMIIMEPLWTLLSTFNKGRKKKNNCTLLVKLNMAIVVFVEGDRSSFL